MKNVLFHIVIISLLSGCSAYQSWFGETKPIMTFAELPSESKLFLWSPKNNAAFVNKGGQGCIQGAEVFNEKGGSVDVSNELLGILKGMNLSSNSSSEEKAIAVTVTNEIVNLRSNTERNTYLSIGMFGLCQLQANGGLQKEELLPLITELINISLEIGVNTAPLSIKQTSNEKTSVP